MALLILSRYLIFTLIFLTKQPHRGNGGITPMSGRKKITVQIPQLPDNQTDKPLNIRRITVGFDESERKRAQK
jgi:hypothetical protein